MNCNDQSRSCHAEPFALLKGKLREASPGPAKEILPLRKLRASAHCAQDDTMIPMLVVKNHYRGPTPLDGVE